MIIFNCSEEVIQQTVITNGRMVKVRWRGRCFAPKHSFPIIFSFSRMFFKRAESYTAHFHASIGALAAEVCSLK